MNAWFSMMYFSVLILRVGNCHRKKPNGVLLSMIMIVVFWKWQSSSVHKLI